MPWIGPGLGILLAGCLVVAACTRSSGDASSASPLPAVDGGSGPPRGIPAPGGGGGGGSADATQGEDGDARADAAADVGSGGGVVPSADASAADALADGLAGADTGLDGLSAHDAAQPSPYAIHLPWPAGLAYEVVSTQELSAARDAYGPSYWAFMTPGTHLQVLAAVSGTVTAVVDGHAQGGGLPHLAQYTNYVEITTEDGVSVRHLHLAQGTASPLLEVGSEVARGQLIGYSGASGFAPSPRIGLDAVDAAGDPVDLCFVTPTSQCATPAPSMPVTSANTLTP